MYCRKCGTKLDADATFCSHCGNEMELETKEEKKKEMKVEVNQSTYAIDLKQFEKYRELICRIIKIGSNIIEALLFIVFVIGIISDVSEGIVYKPIIYVVRFLMLIGQGGLIIFIPFLVKDLLELKKDELRVNATVKQVLICNVIMGLFLFGFYNNFASVDEIESLGIFAIALQDSFVEQIKLLIDLFSNGVFCLVIYLLVRVYYGKSVIIEKEEEQ